MTATTKRILTLGQGWRSDAIFLTIIVLTLVHGVREDLLGEARWLHITGILLSLGGMTIRSAIRRSSKGQS